MQADREDRFDSSDTTSRHGTQTLVTAIAVLVLAAGAYFLAPGDEDLQSGDDAAQATLKEPTAPTVVAPRPEPEAAIVAAPDIPVQASDPVEELPAAKDPVPVAAPTPEELDELMRQKVAEADIDLPAALAAAYSAPYLLDRGISSIDQMARGLMPLRSLNLNRPKGDFAVTREGQQRYVDPVGYARYNSLTSAITSLPADRIAQLFHRFRPQITDAYAALGYPAEAMDNTVIAALDQIISAPVRREPLELRDKGALYAYVDESLEGASDLHKQLLRAGPDNTDRLQRWATQMRSELLRQN
ncbi:MAG: DUF3014 domain-containing protein [Congregibacter sp.]